ncbi:hypothetical protein AGMMS49992_22960 [Clostridia bacterium]|nr:hypothetical protein AGMMS49992_22960 [Clostridia bacterium]
MLRTQKALALLLCLAMLGTLGGLFPALAADKITVDMFEAGGGWDELLASVKDSSELPDFEGEPLTLTFWMAHGTEVLNRIKSELDVVSPEIERIFGIKMDVDNSYDNQGSDLKASVMKHAAAGDFTDLAYGVGENIDLVEAGVLYELRDSGLLEKYAPNIYAAVQKTQPNKWAEGYQATGKQYGVPVDYNGTAENVQRLWPDTDMSRYQYISAPEDARGPYDRVMVRDDILKLAYPEAKTQAEIDALFAEQGYYTREDIYDVPITNIEELNEFFHRIQKAIDDNNITEDGRPVYATYIADGSGENWALLQVQSLVWDGMPNGNNLTYYHPATESIRFGVLDQRFKDDLKMFTGWIQDGVAPRACLVDGSDQFTAKKNNGEYAVLYAWHWMDLALPETKPYQYRKVYFDIPVDTDTWIQGRNEITGYQMSIFKNQVSEKDLPRVLRFLDFLATDVGMLLTCWGPYDAANGLWDYMPTGGRVFKEAYKELEDELVYGVDNKAHEKYNLAYTRVFREGATPAWPNFYSLVNTGGIFSPLYMYENVDASRFGSKSVSEFFASGAFDTLPKTTDIVTRDANIWTFTNDVPELKAFEDTRGSEFDPLVLRVFTAENDAQFEEYFQAVLDLTASKGVNDESLERAKEYMMKTYPASWEGYVKGIAE